MYYLLRYMDFDVSPSQTRHLEGKAVANSIMSFVSNVLFYRSLEPISETSILSGLKLLYRERIVLYITYLIY
jgi:hypothetical protein